MIYIDPRGIAPRAFEILVIGLTKKQNGQKIKGTGTVGSLGDGVEVIAWWDPISNVQSGYDRWATVYDHDANPLQALEEPKVREAIGNARGLSVLDLGCGTGRHALWLAGMGASVTALDFSE